MHLHSGALKSSTTSRCLQLADSSTTRVFVVSAGPRSLKLVSAQHHSKELEGIMGTAVCVTLAWPLANLS